MAKKTFPCGHKGLGQYCHKCQQSSIEHNNQEAIRHEKQIWEQQFKTDAIDLRKLPHKNLVIKARAILVAIKEGQAYQVFNGKRMNYDRHIVSVPIDNDYRILFKDDKDGLVPVVVLSHEEYNTKKPGASKI
ncbi:DUF7682 family zinc-binding protein [Beggiatoa leptomitoformis]|uniref:Uncharacterized protein n=1 Tax=Beggiatoa leptomitoformis TaxID=288004 RepID=A0A2N9YAZ4_9GAMM|nr:hypothetical protein [Beggiatoa leptomitoformis]ALG67010.1 hypothetical protein AL038_03865 [Beggiatoa leptomitoformis]AUI67614.1 hypothetical protein BLE401_02145 [Beggiatoa leptomitoformis]